MRRKQDTAASKPVTGTSKALPSASGDSGASGDRRRPFWNTVPGILTTLAAVITALAGLVGALERAGILDLFPPLDQTATSSSKDCRPTVLETRSIKIFPFSLTNSLLSRKDIYWFKFRGKNDCPQDGFLEVEFRKRRGPVVVGQEPAVFTIPARKKFELDVDPNLTVTNDKFVDPVQVEVTWRIYDDRRHVLAQGPTKIQFWPKNVFYWALDTPEGTPVSKEFLLASLASWTLSKNDEMDELVRELRDEAAERPDDETTSITERWFGHCYERVLRGRVERTGPLARVFPPDTLQTIRTPSQVLQAVNATPLEGALLIAAMSRWLIEERGLQMALFVLQSETGGATPKEFYLAWSLLGAADCDWQAIDIGATWQLGFDDNLHATTKRVCKLVENQPELATALHQRGVALAGSEGQESLAVEFAIAATNYGIRGLP